MKIAKIENVNSRIFLRHRLLFTTALAVSFAAAACSNPKLFILDDVTV